MLPSEVGFGSLFGKWGKLGPLGADEVESGGAADFIESLAEKLFFAVDGVFLQESEKFPLLRAAGSDLGEGGHGVATDFFGGVVEKGEEPSANGFLEVGLLSFGEAGSDGSDNGHALKADIGRGLIKAGNFFLPKGEPRKSP